MSQKITMRYIAAFAALAGLGLAQSPALARSIPASSGRAVLASDIGCFSMNYSTMTNYCSAAKSFEMPLVVDSAGSKTVAVAAYGATTANNVCCFAAGLDRNFTSVWSTGTYCLSSFGSTNIITLTGAYVPAYGYLYANCNVQYGGRVHSVDWNS